MNKDNRLLQKIAFTIAVLFVSVTLANIPAPEINTTYLNGFFSNSSILSFMDTLSGGALSQLSIASFGVSSYISASIILQLLSVMFPFIEKYRKGYHGKKVMQRANFLIAMAITLVSAVSLSLTCRNTGLYIRQDTASVVISVISWLVGAAIVMLLALKVEDYGIGNGLSLILSVNILSRLPAQIRSEYVSLPAGRERYFMIAGIVLILILMYIMVVYLQSGKLQIPIIQNRKNKSLYNDDVYLPMPVNIANVLPVVYASSIIALPQFIVSLFDISTNHYIERILECLSSNYWYEPERWYHVGGLFIYIILTVVFGIFCSQLSFNAPEVAENMKKNGDVIKSIKPGEETVKYLEKRRIILTYINVFFLCAITIIPDMVFAKMGITQLSFIGTSMIIVCSTFNDMAHRIRAMAIQNDPKYIIIPRRYIKLEKEK